MSNALPLPKTNLDIQVTAVIKALYDAAPGYTYLTAFRDYAAQNGGAAALADGLLTSFPASLTSSPQALANQIVENLGLAKVDQNAADNAAKYLALQFTAAHQTGATYGQVLLQSLGELTDLVNDPTFGKAADYFNASVWQSYQYSLDPAHSTYNLAVLQQADEVTIGSDGNPVVPNPGQTFTLTTAAGELVTGTDGNDTFRAILSNKSDGNKSDGNPTAANVVDAANSTLNLGDVIVGGKGTDTLNLTLAGTANAAPAAVPAGVSISGVEIVNLIHTDNNWAPGTLANSATFAGIQQLWQVDNDASGADTFGDVVVAADVTAGFRSTGTADAAKVDVTVAAASATQKSASVALDGVGTGSEITFSGGGLKTISVSGSVATSGGNTLTIDDAAATSTIETINLAISSNTTVDVSALTGVKTLNAANSTGNLTVDTSALESLESATFGSGRDTVTVDHGALKADEVSFDLGAGNDTIELKDSGSGSAALTVKLGAGRDTIALDGTNKLGNIADPDDVEASLITITDFKLGEDTIDISGVNGVPLDGSKLAAAAEAESLADALAYVAGQIGSGAAAVFSWGDDAYVFINGTDAGFNSGDGLIKIVGLDAADLSTGQNGGLVIA